MAVAVPDRETEAAQQLWRRARHDVRPQTARVILELAELRTVANGRDAVAGAIRAVGAGAVPQVLLAGFDLRDQLLCGVVLDIATGEVVAMASFPAIDPRAFSRNRVKELKEYSRKGGRNAYFNRPL